MGKRVTVMLFGKMMRKGVQLDADATVGAVVGTDLRWPDGTTVTPEQIRNTTTTAPGGSSSTVSGGVSATLWSLIISIPAIIKSLAALATDGWIRNDAGVISASSWPYVKNSVALGEALTIPAGHQLLVHGSWTNDGTVIADGELVIL